MGDINRRKFLLASAGAAGLAAAAGAAVSLPQMFERAQVAPLPADTGILVILTLYGGNDGLNTVIPYTDGAYYDARPELAFAPSTAIDLDGAVGLNPALGGLAESWNTNNLAIVRGVGYPKQDRSHFRSMDIWQTANPVDAVTSGWIGRWLDTSGTAAIVEFPGVLYRGGAEQKIRKYLVDNNYVDAVIQLPPDLFFGTTIATCGDASASGTTTTLRAVSSPCADA